MKKKEVLILDLLSENELLVSITGAGATEGSIIGANRRIVVLNSTTVTSESEAEDGLVVSSLETKILEVTDLQGAMAEKKCRPQKIGEEAEVHWSPTSPVLANSGKFLAKYHCREINKKYLRN